MSRTQYFFSNDRVSDAVELWACYSWKVHQAPRWVMKCKGPGDETEAENSVVKMKSVFVVVKTLLFSSIIFSCKCIVSINIPNTGVLDCDSCCLNSVAPAPRRRHIGIPYLENLVVHGVKIFWLACHFPFQACPSLRTCVPLPLTQINKPCFCS